MSCIAAPIDYVRFQYDDPSVDHESMMLLPYNGFSIRYDPIDAKDIE